MSEQADVTQERFSQDSAEQSAPAEAALVEERQETAVPESFRSPWLEYVGSKKKKRGEPFLKKLEKEGYTEPDDTVVSDFGWLATENPERLPRVTELVRAARPLNPRTRGAVEVLALEVLARSGLTEIGAAGDWAEVSRQLQRWMDSQERPLQGEALAVLMVALAVGYLRGDAPEPSVVALIDGALTRPARRGSKKGPQKPPSHPVAVMLSANPTAQSLRPLMQLSQTKAAESYELHQRISALEEAKAGLEEERESLVCRVATLEHDVAGERSRVEALTAELDGYLHKLEDERGRSRGAGGTLLRWLETALDAARAEPPFLPVVRERLEDAIELIAKETE